MKHCPTCGQPLPREDGLSWNPDERTASFGEKSVRFSKGMARVFDTLYRRPTGFEDQERLTAAIYAGDPEGGPESAYSLTGVYITGLRKRLAELGWTVSYSMTKPRRGYRLERRQQEAT